MLPQLFIILIIVFGGLWFLRKLGRTPQAKQKTVMRKYAGAAVVGFAGILALRGFMNAAIPLFILGAGLMGQSSIFPNGFPFGQAKQPGQKSNVETSLLTMELDHDTGSMEGTVKAGPLAGRLLSGLNDAEIQQFHTQCRNSQDQSLALFESWLDRYKADWRGAHGEAGGERTAQSSHKMSTDQALQILGLKKGASIDDIRSAHRRLMKNLHPDHGGSDYLAAQINAAKDVLLG
jgi:hypothetical protein